jgi:hypothetical protein
MGLDLSNHKGQETVLFGKDDEIVCPGCREPIIAFRKDVRLKDDLPPMEDTFRACTLDLATNRTMNAMFAKQEAPHCPHCGSIEWWNELVDYAYKVMNAILQDEFKT